MNSSKRSFHLGKLRKLANAVHKYKHSETPRNIVDQPAKTLAQPRNTSTPGANPHAQDEEYRSVEGFDGEELRVQQATIEDAEQQNVPANYNLQLWDPEERPLILHHMRSVCDPMSFGKWIVDWALYMHGEDSPLTNSAGELWGLLIHLAGKVKQSQEFLRYSKGSKSVRATQVIRVVTESSQGGEQLIQEFQQLLWECEQSMTETRATNALQFGGLSEVDFVSFFLSQEGYLGEVEDFMQSLRLWFADWDQRVGKILRMLPQWAAHWQRRLGSPRY